MQRLVLGPGRAQSLRETARVVRVGVNYHFAYC